MNLLGLVNHGWRLVRDIAGAAAVRNILKVPMAKMDLSEGPKPKAAPMPKSGAVAKDAFAGLAHSISLAQNSMNEVHP